MSLNHETSLGKLHGSIRHNNSTLQLKEPNLGQIESTAAGYFKKPIVKSLHHFDGSAQTRMKKGDDPLTNSLLPVNRHNSSSYKRTDALVRVGGAVGSRSFRKSRESLQLFTEESNSSISSEIVPKQQTRSEEFRIVQTLQEASTVFLNTVPGQQLEIVINTYKTDRPGNAFVEFTATSINNGRPVRIPITEKPNLTDYSQKYYATSYKETLTLQAFGPVTMMGLASLARFPLGNISLGEVIEVEEDGERYFQIPYTITNGDVLPSRPTIEAWYGESSIFSTKIASATLDLDNGTKTLNIPIPKVFIDAPIQSNKIVFVVNKDKTVPESNISAEDNSKTIDIPFITQIPRIMRNKGWEKPAQFMEYWFTNRMTPSEALPKGKPSEWPQGTWSKFNIVPIDINWLRNRENDQSGRVEKAYRQITDPNVVFNDAALSQFATNITNILSDPENARRRRIDYARPRGSEDLEKIHSLHINSRTVGNFVKDPLDNVFGAMGVFGFYAVPIARINRIRKGETGVVVKGYGVYAFDTFDFNYKPAAGGKLNPFDDYLGTWTKPDDVQINLLPSSGDVFNADYRSFRERYGYGEDFFVRSEVERFRLPEPVEYKLSKDGRLVKVA